MVVTKEPTDKMTDVAVEGANNEVANTAEATKEAVSDKEKHEKEIKRHEYFKEELKRLQRSMEHDATKIKAPPVREYYPNCFNSLEPYFNTFTAAYVIEKDATKHGEYQTRQTALGLVDPWVDHQMDVTLLPKTIVKEPAPFKEPPKKEKKQGEGSTILPVFHDVTMAGKDLARKLDYSDVPALREELQLKYTSQAQSKVEFDYKRTKNDFYRMELHKLRDIHPLNRGNMKAAYFAYLQNTPGSTKALKDCIKTLGAQSSEDGSQAGTAAEAPPNAPPAATTTTAEGKEPQPTDGVNKESKEQVEDSQAEVVDEQTN